MKVEKKDLDKAQVELTVELSQEEFTPYLEKGAQKIAKEVKIEGFRDGKAPYDIIKQKVGEMSIMDESARIAINTVLGEVISKNTTDAIGQPDIAIVKLAPENPLIFTVKMSIIPSIELGKYKELGIKEKEVKLDDAELEKTFDHLREMHVKETVSGEKIKDGDKLILNIQMFLDKVPVEGGQAKETTIIVGKDYMVSGFDKKLIDAKKGDTREFEVHYPSDHHQANLSGKNVEFKVEVKDVFDRVLPPLDDELAKKLHFKSAEDLKKNITNNIQAGKKNEARQVAEREVIERVVAKTKFGDLPEMLVQHEAETMIGELEQNVTKQGGKFEDYLSSLKKSRNDLVMEMLPDAVKRVQASLIIREIAKIEKIVVTEKEIDEYLESLVKQYQATPEIEKQIKSEEYRSYAVMTLSNRAVVGKLREWNIAMPTGGQE
ncbi:MAG: trigger factor [Patescibacteria group bacterium]|jgi:trigger factor|nr:trigger factor [Patescibacteria group bacterium]